MATYNLTAEIIQDFCQDAIDCGELPTIAQIENAVGRYANDDEDEGKITVDAEELFWTLFDLKDIEMYEFSADPEEDHELLMDAIGRLERLLDGYELIFKRIED